jgi:hypothetical protein
MAAVALMYLEMGFVVLDIRHSFTSLEAKLPVLIIVNF